MFIGLYRDMWVFIGLCRAMWVLKGYLGSYRVWGQGFPKLGVPVWGPHHKDYRVLGSILGFPH